MILTAYFGAQAQTGVGYQFFDSAGLVGSRVTSGITSPRLGLYVATATPPNGAIGVYWDSDDTEAFVVGDSLLLRLALENLDVAVSTRSSHSAGDVWAAGTRTLSSFGTLVADVVAAVWGAAARTLTAFGFTVTLPDPAPDGYGSSGGGLTTEQAAELDAIKAKTDLITSGAVVILSPVSKTGGIIRVRAGDSWTIPITGLGDLSDAVKLWFSVNKAGAADAAAKLFIEATDGLLFAAGAIATDPTLGSLTIDDTVAGDVTIEVDETVTELLNGTTNTPWTIKKLTSGGRAVTLSSGDFMIAKFGVEATA